MNTLKYILLASVFFTACSDNSKQMQQILALSAQDSIMVQLAKQKDSAIVSYVKTLDEIQNNIDSIKVKEKILSIPGNEPPKSIIEEHKDSG